MDQDAWTAPFCPCDAQQRKCFPMPTSKVQATITFLKDFLSFLWSYEFVPIMRTGRHNLEYSLSRKHCQSPWQRGFIYRRDKHRPIWLQWRIIPLTKQRWLLRDFKLWKQNLRSHLDELAATAQEHFRVWNMLQDLRGHHSVKTVSRREQILNQIASEDNVSMSLKREHSASVRLKFTASVGNPNDNRSFQRTVFSYWPVMNFVAQGGIKACVLFRSFHIFETSINPCDICTQSSQRLKQKTCQTWQVPTMVALRFCLRDWLRTGNETREWAWTRANSTCCLTLVRATIEK